MVPEDSSPDSDAPGRPLSADEFNAAVTAVTNAFGDPTRREIYLLVRDTPAGVTASDVAARFDLHPNVARHHLEKLTSGGYLIVEVGRRDADVAARSAGRPSKRYCATELDDGAPQLGLLDALEGGTNFGHTDHARRLSRRGGNLHYRHR